MSNFVHLHVHTEYSLLDGAAKISTVIRKAKELGMPALAITDHGNMYGAVSFFDACKKFKIKAIIGTEFYTCQNMKLKNSGERRGHLVLLAKNDIGYKNLSYLNATAFRDGYYYKPRIDFETLKEHAEGLICLSACLAGDVARLILDGMIDSAEELVLEYKKLFGDDYYLEMQDHFQKEDEKVNTHLRDFSKKHNIKLVVTNDVHYTDREDSTMQDVLMCVQMQADFQDPKRMKFVNDEFYLKSYEEMLELFPSDQEALQNTIEIADKCTFEFVYGKYMFPSFQSTTGQTSEEFIRSKINEGIEYKYEVETTEIRDRIEMELAVIKKQGYIDYFLIVADYISKAREIGISVGPGRGSGAGSIVAYLLGITNIDPLKFDLYFERFLNPERVSAPDFDVDFEDSRRQEVIEYVKEKYGENRVCKIVTFGSMAAKNAVKDVGRVLKVPYGDLDKITKAIPSKVHKNGKEIDIKRPNILMKVFGKYDPPIKADKKSNEITREDYMVDDLVTMYEDNPDIKQVIDIAMKVEDMPRQASTHACGVIIGGDVLDKHMPLSKNGEDITSQFTGVELEHLGFLKMDFLGLRNLTDIKMAIDYVEENYGRKINFDKMDCDDAKVYELISTGNTTAIFQIESAGFQKFLKELKPTCLEDIVAAVSLYRPGPMSSIPRFIKNKHNPDQITYDHELLKPILSQTYGCIVYQEQVMKIVQELAGYTLGQADMVRRMMGKKQVEAMQKEANVFIYGREEMVDDHGKVIKAIDGCVKRGVNDTIAKKIWSEMEDFAKYAFNKSHAAAYSVVTYQTAYLKTYYEPEFITAVLNNRITNIDEIINYANYAKDQNIQILPPDINESKVLFSVKDKKIRFGLVAIKGVGFGAIEEIIKERNENGKYLTFDDFIYRVDSKVLNKRLVENMIFAGVFDSLGNKRSQLIAVYANLIDKAMSIAKDMNSSQISFFESIPMEREEVVYPNIPEFDVKVKFGYEKQVSGIFLTGHPMEEYMDKFTSCNFSTKLLYNIEEDEDGNITYTDITDGTYVSMGGVITKVETINTKTGAKMAFAQIEDMYGSIEGVFFNKTYDKFRDLLKSEEIVIASGRIQIKDGRKPSILIDKLINLKTKDVATKNDGVAVKKTVACLGIIFDEMTENKQDEVTEILEFYKGNIQVFYKIQGKNYKTGLEIRSCEALKNELLTILKEKQIKFFDL